MAAGERMMVVLIGIGCERMVLCGVADMRIVKGTGG